MNQGFVKVAISRVYVYDSVRSLGGLPLYSETSHERNLGTSPPGFPKKILEYRPYSLFISWYISFHMSHVLS